MKKLDLSKLWIFPPNTKCLSTLSALQCSLYVRNNNEQNWTISLLWNPQKTKFFFSRRQRITAKWRCRFQPEVLPNTQLQSSARRMILDHRGIIAQRKLSKIQKGSFCVCAGKIGNKKIYSLRTRGSLISIHRRNKGLHFTQI